MHGGAPMKLATAAAVGVLGGSGTAVSLFAQLEPVANLDSSDPALYVLGVSLTSLAGALVYIVRQMANGKLCRMTLISCWPP